MSKAEPREVFRWGSWFLVALLDIGALLNFASASRWRISCSAPLSVVLAFLCAVVAHRAANGSRFRRRGKVRFIGAR